ncbi:MAG TPA: ComEC/Rec2 family competence protein [Chitinophagaceae bacterium]|nr:ComEC/Rec2 family competence protein [Chitinophagaceae bacterium]
MPIQIAWCLFCFSIFLSFLSFLLSNFSRYKLSAINGTAITMIFFALGSLMIWYNDIRHSAGWYGNYYKPGDFVLITLQEPPIEKTNSYKTLATVTALTETNKSIPAKGGVILYFKKDSSIPKLDFGTQIIFSKPLQEIKNAGNPGGFDYKRYNLFRGITHQAYLKRGDFSVLNKKKQTLYGKILFPIRDKVLATLRRYIRGEKEQGLAEALLIGYKDDLDKNLVQSYTNTGVVHVIAISGLHLGLIYWLLIQLLKPLRKRKISKWLTPFVIITGLWLFTLLAGGQPSVLRSAVMFTCIVLAEGFSRKTSIYNTLALSAFILLCINPFWLWDVGFQLSYAAVLSIVIFMKPIYSWFYIRNKALDFIWKMNAVSIAAQLLTTPFSIYHFHQFPNFFLFTNFLVVPISSVIVLGEIFLCAISFIPFIATLSGKTLSWLIWLMNSYVERIEALPYSLWDGIQVNITQAVLLIIIVAGFGYWLLEKQKAGAWVATFALLFFISLHSYSFYQSSHQHNLIVYNVPKHQAIDIMNGRACYFNGDSDLLADDFARNFHLKPSRIFYRVEPGDQASNSSKLKDFYQFGSKRILLIDRDIVFDSSTIQIPIDLLIISKSPKLYLKKLYQTFNFKQVVFDGSVPAWKLKYWTKDCDSLHVPYHNVNEKGAFVMNLN